MTFEDKKRENFERGNLELEKRRQALQEQQRKEQERLAALEREEQERKVNYFRFLLQHCVHLSQSWFMAHMLDCKTFAFITS